MQWKLAIEWLVGLPGPVRCWFEAGPTGFGLDRAAVAAGIGCQVIAPSKTPRPPGDRNKSDRREDPDRGRLGLHVATVACARELSGFLWAAAIAP